MDMRTATLADLDCITAVEQACFPPTEAANRADFEQRLRHYADHFLLLFQDKKLIAFIDGMVSDEADLHDEMYANAALHQPNGSWQMIFGVNTLPEFRQQGHSARLINQFILKARQEYRQGVVLTCKTALVPYYSKFGFMDEGVSVSEHGGVQWHQMRLRF